MRVLSEVKKIKNYKQSILKIEDGAGEPLVTLELKPYIQPFERILARAELSGLIEPGKIKDPYDGNTESRIAIATQTPLQELIERLAYWQRAGSEVLHPTTQVLFETSENSDFGQVENHVNLPKRRMLRYGPHDIHEYRGKFFPQLVKSLVNFARVPKGAVVIDPMCGSGTANCEAHAMGMQTLGLDLNPLSIKIAFTKTALLEVDPKFLQSELENIEKNIKEISSYNLKIRWEDRDLKYLNRWFDSHAISEIYKLLEVIDLCGDDGIKNLAEISLSNIVRKISWQKETDLRVRKEITKYEKGKATKAFLDELNRQKRKLVSYLHLISKVGKLPKFEIKEGDSKNVNKIFESWIGECDVLITSPPYAMALPYLDTDRLSLIILGLMPRRIHRNKDLIMIGNREISEAQRLELWEAYQNRRSELPETICKFIDKLAKFNHNGEVGFRRRNLPALLAKYFLDMAEVMKNSRDMMKPGKHGFFVVGNNSTRINGKRVDIPTNEFLWEIGKTVGWKQEKLIDMELLPSRDIFRKNRGSSETILVFRS